MQLDPKSYRNLKQTILGGLQKVENFIDEAVSNEPKPTQCEESKIPISPPSAEQESLIKDSKGTKMVWEEEEFQFEKCFAVIQDKILCFL